MVCYSPLECKHISNCTLPLISNHKTNASPCAENEHRLTLLDSHFFSEILNEYCLGVTCCKTMNCSSNDTGMLFSTHSPTPFETDKVFEQVVDNVPSKTDDKNDNNTMVVYVSIPVIFIIALICLTIRLKSIWRKHSQTTNSFHSVTSQNEDATMIAWQ